MPACPACRGIPCRCFDPDEKFVPVKRCDGCDHWAGGMPIRVIGRDEIIGHMGDCRRRAPVVTVNRFDVAQTKWPQTRDEERCGDWEAATS